MNYTKIEETLREVLQEVQEQTGEQAPQDITDDMQPIGDLAGFDSLCAVSATTELAERFAIDDIDSKLFWSKENGKPLSVKEIVDRLCQILGVKEEPHECG